MGAVPKWEIERARRVHRICRCIEGRHARGQSLHRAVRWFAWYWRGRHYNSDPARPMRLGAQTIRRLLYQWRAGGRTPEAVALQWHRGAQKLAAGAVLDLARIGQAPGIRTFQAAYDQLPSPIVSASAFYYAMPAEVRKPLLALFAARRRVESCQRLAKLKADKFAANHSPAR
jgi:hypothetical protein